MNYIKEINAFHILQETNPLTTAAAHLWSVLMHVNNRTGWKKQFTVAASLLAIKAALTDGTFKRARKELLEKGYIRFTSQGANRAAVYEMISLVQFSEENSTNDTYGNTGTVDEQKNKPHVTTTDRTDDSVDRTIDHSIDHTVDPLFKQNETKTNNTKPAAANAIPFFQENFVPVSPYVAEDMLHWVNHTDELLVLHAMKLTLNRGRNNWGYVRGILQSWTEKGITTVEGAKKEEQAFKREKQQYKHERPDKHTYFSAPNNVPDWFAEHKKQQELKREVKEREELKYDPVEKSAEVSRRLAVYMNERVE